MSNACVNFDWVIDSGKPEINKFVKLAEDYPDNNYEACVVFTRQVGIVEGILIQTYAVAVRIARNAESLEAIASTWEAMSAFCEAAIGVLSQIKDKHPNCGTQELYDKALDYKPACIKRLKATQKEIECQKVTVPTGLFPAMI